MSSWFQRIKSCFKHHQNEEGAIKPNRKNYNNNLDLLVPPPSGPLTRWAIVRANRTRFDTWWWWRCLALDDVTHYKDYKVGKSGKHTSRLGKVHFENLQKNDHTVEVDEVRLNKVRPACWEISRVHCLWNCFEQIAKTEKWNWVWARATLWAACTGLPKSSGRRPYLAVSVARIVGLAWFKKL